MSAPTKPARLLGISGSLRTGSTNTIVLHSLAGKLGPDVALTVFPLNDIPLYNSDLDGAALPEAVHAFRAAIAGHDGLVLCTPEYNHGIPGVLKNALDWASRPAMRSPLRDKPCLVMTSSPGYVGGARAHVQMQETLSSCLARVVPRPQVVIAGILQKIEDGELTDTATLSFCLDAIADLVREIRLLAPLHAA